MAKKDAQDPRKRLFLEEVLQGVSSFFRKLNRKFNASSAREQESVDIHKATPTQAAPTSTSKPVLETTWTPRSIPITPIEPELVFIPGGRFMMGNDPTRHLIGGVNVGIHDEMPQHEVYVGDFYIAKYPVTNAEYKRFLGANPKHPVPFVNSRYAAPYNWGNESRSFPLDKADHPVVRVSWDDAVAYCWWLSRVTGRSYRLPTEAEWEKAARGTDGRIYPWGDQVPDRWRCNFDYHVGITTPVKSYPQGASPYGVEDMSGNVSEWCHSLYKPYPYRAEDGREDPNPQAEGERVQRGGDFLTSSYSVTCTRRMHMRHNPDFNWAYHDYIGFRVALAPA